MTATIACRRLPGGLWRCQVSVTEQSGDSEAHFCYEHQLRASSAAEAEEIIRKRLAIRAKRLNGGHQGDAAERHERCVRRKGGDWAGRGNRKPKLYGEGKY